MSALGLSVQLETEAWSRQQVLFMNRPGGHEKIHRKD